MSVPTPSGNTLEQYMIFKALVDGESKCISYVGVNTEVIGNTEIVLTQGPVGYFNLGQCVECFPDVNPTPTPTQTPTVTPTLTQTPTPSLPQQFYVYKNCNTKSVTNISQNKSEFSEKRSKSDIFSLVVVEQFLIQNFPGPSLNSSQIFQDSMGNCWSFYGIYPSYPSLPPGSDIVNYTGNYFTGINNPTFYTDCKTCLLSVLI